MDIRTTARRTAAVVAVTAPLALMAPPASAEEGAAAQDAGTTISGVAWLDQDSDGVRDAGEPAFADHTMYLADTGAAVRTGADGRYTFTGLQAGLSYRVGSMDRSLLDGHGWSYDKHWEPNGSDFDAQTGLASFRAGERNADTGLVLAQNDYRVSQIIVVPGGPERTEYRTGDVLDVYAGVYISGNASDQYGAKMTLPAGLRKLQRLGGIPAFTAEDEPDEVTGMWHERKMPGPIEFLGARVVVDEPISASEITVEVWDGVFGPSDPDLGNNTLSRAFSARQRVQPGTGGEPTTEPTTGPAVVPVARKTEPLADTGASALGLIGLGGSVLAGGGGALWAARRKRV